MLSLGEAHAGFAAGEIGAGAPDGGIGAGAPDGGGGGGITGPELSFVILSQYLPCDIRC